MSTQPVAIPIRELVRRSGRTRAAVYKAIKKKRLTKADSFGVAAVSDDKKLSDFVSKAKADLRNKKKAKCK